MDILGSSSGVIAPHGLCSMWMPNKKEIHGDSSNEGTAIGASLKSESEESTPGVSASFSCEICNKTFASRGELRQHTLDNHSKIT
jgi:hypothetical protein